MDFHSVMESSRMPSVMDKETELQLLATVEETNSCELGSMVLDPSSRPFPLQTLALVPPSASPGARPLTPSPSIHRRIEDQIGLTLEGQSIGSAGVLKAYGGVAEEFEIQSPIQNQKPNLNSPTIPFPVPESGRRYNREARELEAVSVPYSQECTEDVDYSCHYVEGRDWEKVEWIGSGASGSCFIATDKATKTVMVVKQTSLNFSNRDDAESEVEVMRSIRHTNVITFLDSTYDKHQQHLNIFMEWMEGGSLEARVRNGGLGEGLICHYARQIIHGLKYLHDHKIAHRDIKGANILLDSLRFSLRIADFGAAARLRDRKKFYRLAGTPPFMAPEVVRASEMKGYDLKCDVWSFGCMLIEMATGKPPWVQNGQHYERWVILYKIGSSKIPPTMPTFSSKFLKDLAIKCLQLNPADRPSSDSLFNITSHTSYHDTA